MDEEKLTRQVAEGRSAAREYEATEAAFDRLDADYVAKWRATADPVARERVWVALQILVEVRADLQTKIRNGRIAQQKLEEGDKGPADNIV